LPLELQRRLNNTPIRAFVLDQGTDESDRADLFRRLNTSGKKLEDAEVRKGVFPGPFLDLVLECAKSPQFLKLTPSIGGSGDAESDRQELVTRFFVYVSRYKDFRHDVRKFLDAATLDFNRTLTGDRVLEMRAEFFRTMEFLGENYPRAFYRTMSGRIVPRVRFEGISVGTALALRERPTLQVRDFSWMHSPEFAALARTDASNSGPKLRGRIEFVRDRLLSSDESVGS
jgi:hypothetical protein